MATFMSRHNFDNAALVAPYILFTECVGMLQSVACTFNDITILSVPLSRGSVTRLGKFRHFENFQIIWQFFESLFRYHENNISYFD